MSFSNKNSVKVTKKLDHLNPINQILFESNILEVDLVPDRDMFESIQREYFDVVGKFDICGLELSKIPKSFNSNDITEHCKHLIQQHYIVSKKVLLLVLQKQSKCKEIFDKIVEIEKYLTNTVKICKMCRNDLNLATHQFISSSLHILYHFRKQKILESILNVLYSIKTLYQTKDRLQQFLNEENYPKVISLISECQKAAITYNKYHCVISLYSNLSDILEQVEENLDLSLSKICTNFDINNYSSIQVAYNFLGKSQTAMDQLHMHFTAAVHNTAFNSILKYSQENEKKQYNYICNSISLSNFLPCLIELCRSLLVILQSYYLIVDKLRNGIIKVFNEVENKITVYLDGFDLIPLKFEEFIEALGIIDRVSAIGNKIFERNMTKLYICIKDKFINYFNFYHTSRLDELKIFLENDGWKLCPVKSNFNITQLLEFYETNVWTQDFINGIALPFNVIMDESTKEDFLQTTGDCPLKDLFEYSDDDEIPEELKYDFVDEINKESTIKKKRKHIGPIITNTTLSVLRICGKYLQVTRLFKDETKIVIQYMIQMFELYLYAVYSFFATDLQVSSDFGAMYGTNLKRTISRIKDSLIIDTTDISSDVFSDRKIHQPYLSSIIDLNDSSKLFCMLERFVAVESLIFLGQQYESFKFYLDSIIFHKEDQRYLNQFYLQTVTSTTALRKPVYMAAISKAFDVSNILILMNKVDWELKDVISQHSEYIDYTIQEIVSIKTKFLEIQNHVPLSKDVYQSLWESIAHLITHTFVEGFSNAKKCSNGGRALMQLDFTQLISKFETITSLRPMPYQEYVASYIKAYYLPESGMEAWIKTHTEYSAKHVIGLISCMYQNRKVKQRLLTFIEDQRLTR
ncbi:PREDICTED: coiled-coil domain-containing protein 132 [Ceratosolen solmsi marchali]|uniref:Coiled-coil domain-containing protein 132 n=1 Tax=Ceratosolen solmsi marchali TaxID=326594 RepID=A0AAJ7E2U3_9HYME|nr:PREDICTED: coiled-coil domain-containing protein 132 [Ceratosolen solmsi marchali]